MKVCDFLLLNHTPTANQAYQPRLSTLYNWYTSTHCVNFCGRSLCLYGCLWRRLLLFIVRQTSPPPSGSKYLCAGVRVRGGGGGKLLPPPPLIFTATVASNYNESNSVQWSASVVSLGSAIVVWFTISRRIVWFCLTCQRFHTSLLKITRKQKLIWARSHFVWTIYSLVEMAVNTWRKQ